jgi:small-conductance mechanosensitive channel
MPNGELVELIKQMGVDGELHTKLIASAVALFMLWLAHTLVQRFVVTRFVKNPIARFNVHRAVRYLAVFSGVFLVGRIWFTGFQSVATLFGLVGAGVAIALKDPLTNLAGWVFIVTRVPFRIGERIQIGEHTGDVVDIGLFQFQLHELGAWMDADQSTGRVIFVPNGRVFTSPQINYHRGLPFIFEDLAVNITFESNKGDTGFYLLGGTKDVQVFTSVRHSGVRLRLRYAVDPRNRTPTATAVWEEVLAAFDKEPDIMWAYRTYRRVELDPPPREERVPEHRAEGKAPTNA